MDTAQVLKVIRTGEAGIKLAGSLKAELDQITADRTKQAAAVAEAIPAAIEALIAARVIGEHEKAAAVAALSDPVACIETLTNILNHNVKSAAASLGGPATGGGSAPAPAAPVLESERVWIEGVRALKR